MRWFCEFISLDLSIYKCLISKTDTCKGYLCMFNKGDHLSDWLSIAMFQVRPEVFKRNITL